MSGTGSTGSTALALFTGVGARTPLLPDAATGWTTIGELFNGAGFSADLDAAALSALGTAPTISTVGFLSEVDINGFLAATFPGSGGTLRLPGLAEKSTFRKAWTAARLLLGAGPFAVGSPPGSGPAAAAAKRVKLSSLVDVTAEAELNPLTPEAVRDMFEKYSLCRGEPPAPGIEPTAGQFGAVKQLVDSGAPPYVDFALFGPHGRRLLKKLTYTEESCFNPFTGDWIDQTGAPRASRHRLVDEVMGGTRVHAAATFARQSRAPAQLP